MHRTCSLRVLSRSVSGTEIEYTHVITVFPLLWNFTCFAVWKIVYPTLYLGYYHGVFPHEVALRGELSTRLIKGACSWNFHLRVTSLPVLRNFSTFLYWFFAVIEFLVPRGFSTFLYKYKVKIPVVRERKMRKMRKLELFL